ncbi:MAG TPA: alpha/beta fold hydrolase [Candidatus Eisenbacteria bacterium]|nr:alpha/beta fold hydrolase [Candidatus Eisenbacteria bacterium]
MSAGGGRARVRALALAACAAPALAGAALAVNPSAKHATTPEALQLRYEAVRFPAADSVGRDGWWFAAPDSGPIVVIAPRGHGTMADMLPAVAQWQARGFGVLTFDYRGFGPGSAPGDTLAQVVYASQWVDDMVGALRYARARAGRTRHVFAWGQDLGSDVCVAAAGRDRRLCDAVAVEGLFRTSQEELAVHGLSGFPEVMERHRRLVDPIDEPLSAASRMQVPLMVVLAGRDSVARPATTRQIAARNPIRWDSLTFPDARHDDADRQPGYFDKLAAWLRQWLPFPTP